MDHDRVSLEEKTALVTGGAHRLGRSTALALARAGSDVLLHYNRSPEAAEQTAAEIRALGRAAWLLQGDLEEREVLEDLFASAREQCGKPIDFLINNASIFPEERWEDFSVDAFDRNMQINALAPLLLAREFAAQAESGAIVNFLDTMIQDYDKRHLSYHISKRVLYTFTRILALELAPGVRVNAVAPGLVLPPAGETEAYLERLASSNPLQSYGSPDGIADAVLFLLQARFVTGQVIFVDGGRNLRGAMYG